MPWVEALSDPRELRRCIRDLVALSTLPAIWKNYDPQQIADSVAAALVSMLNADFVHVALPGRRDELIIEVTHASRQLADKSLGAIRAAIRKQLPLHPAEQTLTIADPFGTGTLRVAIAPIGFGGDATLVVGSSRLDFPSETELLLLGIGANDATIALQRWHAETDERRFHSLIEQSSDFIGFASLDGRPQFINPAGLQVVGLAGIEEASRLHVLDFLAPKERVRARDEYWPIMMRTGRWTGEVKLRHFKTGAAMPFLVDWFRIDHPRSGQAMNIATVSRDLRDQKRYEVELRRLNETLENRVSTRTAELADANERLVAEMAERERADRRLHQLQRELFHAGRLSVAGQMAGALAHELNQPLTAATNSFHAARRVLAKGGREELSTVQEIMGEAAEQMLRAGEIVRRLRDFVTPGQAERRLEDVPGLIEEASALALTGSGALGIQLHYELDPNAAKVFADRIQVQQVLINLIRNAMEAMAAGGPRELRIATTSLKDGAIEIAVADSGVGLTKATTSQLFKPFMSTKRDGMGLGLLICRSIVEAHGGKLVGEPNRDGGAIFRFTLAAPPNGASDAG